MTNITNYALHCRTTLGWDGAGSKLAVINSFSVASTSVFPSVNGLPFCDKTTWCMQWLIRILLAPTTYNLYFPQSTLGNHAHFLVLT